jgi:uncharacterized protein YdaU (DUF1376 family)
MRRTDPAMPFYVNDWLSSPRVTCMTLEQQGAFVRLLCFCWASQNASIPDDDEQLAFMSGLVGKWLDIGCPLVRDCFEPHPDQPGKLTNAKLYELWKERQEWRAKSRAGGQASAKNRRNTTKTQPSGNQTATNGATTNATKRQPNGNTPSPSPSTNIPPAKPTVSSPPEGGSKRFRKPTVAQVREYMTSLGTDADPEQFHDWHEARGWVLSNRKKMVDWKAAVRTWIKNHQQFNGKATSNGQSLTYEEVFGLDKQ